MSWTMDKLKELFREMGRRYFEGQTPNMPSDKFLELAAGTANYFQSKLEKVEAHVGGGSLWLQTQPSDIGVEINPKGYLRMWLEFEAAGHEDLRDIWRGEFEKLIKGTFRYKELRIDDENFEQFNLEPSIDTFLLICAKFSVKLRELKETLGEFEASRDKLYNEVTAKLTKILK